MFTNRKKRFGVGKPSGLFRPDEIVRKGLRFAEAQLQLAGYKTAVNARGYNGGIRTARGRIKHAIPRNEPILFSLTFRQIIFIYRNLCRLQTRLQMGSFWKNEPILEGLLGAFGAES